MTSDPDRTILITGGCGYIGAQFIRDLATSPGFEQTTIRILDNLHRENHHVLLQLPEQGRYQFIEGDLMDPAAVRQALDGVDIVVHLAALVKTPFSYDHPEWTTHVNHWGTARLVEDCLRAGVDRFVFASSASVYGPGGPHDEKAECAPIGPYSRSKLAAEERIEAAAEQGLDPCILRLGTVYGGVSPGIRFDAVPNNMVYMTGTGRKAILPSHPEQRWPFLHVQDASRAFRFVIENQAQQTRRVYNVAEGDFQVSDPARIIQDHLDEAEIRFTGEDEFPHFSMEIDTTAFKQAGFQPQHRMEEALPKMLEQLGSLVPLEDPLGYIR